MSDPAPPTSPPHALEEFTVRARTLVAQQRLDAAAVQVLDALDQAGVKALVLKGAALSRLLYRQDEHRGYFDVDLLVAPTDVAAAGQVLAVLGYLNASEVRGIDDVAGIQHAENWSRLLPGQRNEVIDLHWRLDGSGAAPEVVWPILSSRRTTFELAGRQVPTLDQAGLALHLALHGAQHGPGDFKAMGDLRRGLERWPEEVWRDAAGLAAQLVATEAFATGLRLVEPGVEIAQRLELPTTDAMQWAIANQHLRPRGAFHWQAFVEARGFRARLNVLRRSLFPTRAWVVWEYPRAERGGVWLLAGYGAHLVRVVGWARAVAHFRRLERRQRL